MTVRKLHVIFFAIAVAAVALCFLLELTPLRPTADAHRHTWYLFDHLMFGMGAPLAVLVVFGWPESQDVNKKPRLTYWLRCLFAFLNRRNLDFWLAFCPSRHGAPGTNCLST